MPLAVLPSDFGHEEIAGIGDLEDRGRLFNIIAFVFFHMPEAGDDRENRGVVLIVTVIIIAVFKLVFLAVREGRAIRGVGAEPRFGDGV